MGGLGRGTTSHRVQDRVRVRDKGMDKETNKGKDKEVSKEGGWRVSATEREKKTTDGARDEMRKKEKVVSSRVRGKY